MRDDQFISVLNWQNICHYCSNDLPDKREYVKYCSTSCKRSFAKTDFEALDQYFKGLGPYKSKKITENNNI